MKEKNSIKNITFMLLMLLFLLIILIFIIVYFIFKDINRYIEDVPSENIVDESKEEDVKTGENTISTEEQFSTLKKVDDVYTYFLMRHCLKLFYDYSDYENISLNYIDTEVIDSLNLKQNNFINIENSGFCIDEIYKQDIKEDENIYVVYYRLGENSEKIQNLVTWVRVDTKNRLFSIYPYEYLKLYQYLNFKEDNFIELDTSKKIDKNEYNTYENDDIIIDSESCMNELFARYKFDLLLDVEHLYNTLDNDYRESRFQSLEELKKYIKDNKTELYLDTLSSYKANNYDTYVRYIGITNNDRHYIFYVTSLMKYTLSLDNYTIVISQDIYNASLPNVQAKYCIERVIQAINDKNYEFVYEKLNPIQKNNYYSNISDFEEFIKNTFYDKTSYQMNDDYLKISSDVYQYDVKITDATGNEISYIRLTMAITLKDDTDFVVSIVK